MEWIVAEELIPLGNPIVLVCDRLNDFVTLGRYVEEENTFVVMNLDNIEIDSVITHWMPLPELPELPEN